MSLKLENFLAAPSMEMLNLAKKTDLLNIADHYALTSVKPSMLKHEIKNILIKFLVDEEILEPSALFLFSRLKLVCNCRNLKSSDDSAGKIQIRPRRKNLSKAIKARRKNKSTAVGTGRKN